VLDARANKPARCHVRRVMPEPLAVAAATVDVDHRRAASDTVTREEQVKQLTVSSPPGDCHVGYNRTQTPENSMPPSERQESPENQDGVPAYYDALGERE